MNSKDFQENALKTESIPETANMNFDAIMASMSIAISAANVVDVIKKSLFYGKPIDKDALTTELRGLSELAMELRVMNHSDSIVYPESAFEIEPSHVKDLRILHGAIGMFTEAGEMLEVIRTFAAAQGEGADREFDTVNFCEEVGDSDWYKAILHDALGVDEEQIRGVVIAKLRKRYASKFQASEAIDRDVAAEREILDAGMVVAPVELAA